MKADKYSDISEHSKDWTRKLELIQHSLPLTFTNFKNFYISHAPVFEIHFQTKSISQTTDAKANREVP